MSTHNQALVDALRATLGDRAVSVDEALGEVTLVVAAGNLRDVMTMLRAASLGETQLLSDCVHRTDLLARAETELRSNVNLKQLLANLAAQWVLPA